MIRFLHLAVLTGFLAAPLLPQAESKSVAARSTADSARPKSKAKAKTRAKAKPPAVALARFSGSYADLPEGGADLTSLLLGSVSKPKSFYGLMDQLEELAGQKATREVLLDLSGAFGMNAVQLAEMERCLRKLRKSGKKLHAYIENATSGHLQIAAQCDRVIMADMGMIDIASPSLSVTFMKDALDLLGVQMDVVRCGDFKGAVEPYVLSQMSDHLRSHYVAMLGKINDDIVRRIASGRGIATALVRKLQARRLLTARQALDVGLVDELVPWIGATKAFAKVASKNSPRFENVLKKKKRKSLNFFSLMTNLLNPKAQSGKIEPGLVVLHLSGTIIDGTKAAPGSIVSGPTVREIRRITKNDKVKGVVVRINSPGGSATASEAILLALEDLAKAKPIVFSMGRVAASGGYYVTCVGRPIFAEAGTITGSIGVFGMRPSVGALMRRVGLQEEIVGLDQGATFTALGRPWTGEQRSSMQKFVNEIYDRFTGHVSASRKMPVSDVLKLAGGRVWSGEQAVANRLVDHVGGLQDAMKLVAKEADLGKDYEVTHLPEPVDMFDAMIQEMMGARALLSDPTLRLIARRAGGLDSALRILLDALASESPTRVWAIMPESLRIK